MSTLTDCTITRCVFQKHTGPLGVLLCYWWHYRPTAFHRCLSTESSITISRLQFTYFCRDVIAHYVYSLRL